MLGVPGLMRAYRAGTVALANAVGTGVADDKAIYNWVAEMIRFYLGEEPLLDNVRTYLMSDPEALDHALDRMDELVFKPRASPAARASSSVRRTTRSSSRASADAIRRSPEKRIAQELVNLSTVPTADEYGNLAPRHVDLRPFAVFGETISIVPGGLSRVAMITCRRSSASSVSSMPTCRRCAASTRAEPPRGWTRAST